MSCVCYTSSLINHSDWVLCRGEEREPGTHCSLLCYLKISGNFCLPTERPKCRIILPVRRFSWAVLKSETISLTVCIASFKTVPRERFRQSRARPKPDQPDGLLRLCTDLSPSRQSWSKIFHDIPIRHRNMCHNVNTAVRLSDCESRSSLGLLEG